LNPLKKLLGQTAVYGLGNILGRLITFIIPIFFSQDKYFSEEQLGVYTNLYAYVGFFVVLFTYGMETALFRYAGKSDQPKKIVSTAFISLSGSSLLLGISLFLLSPIIADFLEIPDYENFVTMLACVLAIDAICAIPFAYLRFQNKAEKFASIRLINIVANFSFCIYFMGPLIIGTDEVSIYQMFDYHYDPSFNIGYLLQANLIASILTLVLLLPVIVSIPFEFDGQVWRSMIKYASPLLIVGFAGVINEMLDRAILLKLLEGSTEEKLAQLGIYGINYRMAMSMAIAVQAFRMAAEPFFFSKARDKDSPKLFAMIMKYFILFCWVIFLAEALFINQIKHIPGKGFEEGYKVIPIILLANLCLGIYYNLAVWYKLTDKTHFGAIISVIGAVISIIGNFILIPHLGYMGSAWTTLICYLSMVVISYIWGRKHLVIPYNLRKIFFYSISALGAYFISMIPEPESGAQMITSTVLLLTYISIIIIIENPRKLLS